MRRATIALILALALWSSTLAQAPTVTAQWTAPHTALLTWSGGELWRIADGKEVWIEGPSPVVLSPGADQDKAPRAGDRFEVRDVGTSAVVAVAFLGEEPRWHTVTLVLVVRPP